MKPNLLPLWITLVISLAATGCTSKQIYDANQGWQHRECNKIADQTERDRCMQDASASYEDYKRKTEGSKN